LHPLVQPTPVRPEDDLAREQDEDDQDDDPAAATAATETAPKTKAALQPIEYRIQQE
jgi:hypothetical protein